ncbi:glycosyltransferase [Methylolobus aquaticus]
MLFPIKVVDLEVSRPLPDLSGLEGYVAVKGLVRLQGVPIGYVEAPVTNGTCSAEVLSRKVLDAHAWNIANVLLQKGMVSEHRPEELRLEQLFDLPAAADTFWQRQAEPAPLVTVAVCTRDRAEDLARCLDGLSQLDYPSLDLLVVDNAPSSRDTEALVRSRYPSVRYVCEPRPGLDWARNRAILEAKGEILAYTDDDVVVDSQWVKALAQVFVENPEVMGLTGLVVPHELETEAQVLFEYHGGFGRGFQRKWARVPAGRKVPWRLLGTGQFGTGANMAFRHSVFEEIGGFDPALDVGTPTNGGGDHEMYFRVLKAGHTLVYEPAAMVRHRHRREYATLKTQLANNGSIFAYWQSVGRRYPEERKSSIKIAAWWMLYWNVRRWLVSLVRPGMFPRDLIVAEMLGSLRGFTTYRQSLRSTQAIVAKFGEQMATPQRRQAGVAPSTPQIRSVGVRTVELTQPLAALSDLEAYDTVRVFALWDNRPLGSVDIANQRQSVSVTRLAEALVAGLGQSLIRPGSEVGADLRWADALSAVKCRLAMPDEAALPRLSDHIPVSIVLATFDRPDDLRRCLTSLSAQKTSRRVEIVVVDNHPQSGLTPPVVSDFPGVVLVTEPRQGLAYARNAGFLAASGEIMIATDDDVTMPEDWLEKLVAPFSRADVMVVNGHVLPLQLDTPSQQAFENYGGLGRGFHSFEVNGSWYARSIRHPAKTWNLGATANAAFRATIFADPRIGLMDEVLGPGMPSGVGEDTYLFYRVLKAGYSIVYVPQAYVWHKHRREDEALKKQLYNYSKGHVSYNLNTWIRDGDWRGLFYVAYELPKFQLSRLIKSWFRRSAYPSSLVLLEIKGNLAGPWSLWQSYRRVKREGRSGQPTPVRATPPHPGVVSPMPRTPLTIVR